VAICYESIYGRFYTEYIKKGANLMFIITNDGWWDNTPGYRQHLTYASLRAVETRRSIARSANTGVSALINQRGEITARAGWWTPAVLKGTLHANDKHTFYVTHGDYIGRLACFVMLLLLLVTAVRRMARLTMISDI
jgi:apolipoprotein N-acyltransferase